jgi:hypothetical protein
MICHSGVHGPHDIPPACWIVTDDNAVVRSRVRVMTVRRVAPLLGAILCQGVLESDPESASRRDNGLDTNQEEAPFCFTELIERQNELEVGVLTHRREICLPRYRDTISLGC